MEIEDHPSALRNRQPILEVLSRLLTSDARVLEVASGQGTHGAYCTAAMPGLAWQVTEADPAKLDVLQHRYNQQTQNQQTQGHSPEPSGIKAPFALDALNFDWSSQQADALLAINLVHISPFSVTQALMAGASQVLSHNGLLLLYGPYQVDGKHTAPSNAEFDANLRQRNPSWGIRDIQALETAAAAHHLVLKHRLEMPANNKFLVFARRN